MPQVAITPFPFKVPRHPVGEPFPTAEETFSFQMRSAVDVPGLDDGLYACVPDGVGGWDWQPWFRITDPLVLANLHVLGDVDIDDDLNVDGDAVVDASLTVGGALQFNGLAGTGTRPVVVDSDGTISTGSSGAAPGTINLQDGGSGAASAVTDVNFTPAAAWTIGESPAGTGTVAPIFGSSANTFAEGNHTQASSTITDFTEAAQDVIGAAVAGGTGITATYDDGTGLTTIDSTITQYTDEQVRDTMGTALVAGNNIDITVSDGSDTITIAVETLVAADLSDVTATAAELNILDGVTATAAELNALDGITATVTELNYTDGVTSAIQTQLNAKAPTASPSFTGTVTLPTGLTGVLRADSGVVSTDADVTDLVSAATTSAAGKVELATTAETTTGTDATRAVTPDGLHDMTSLAGAAWFLDEDAMTSDSATKTVSQQSVKAYADTKQPLDADLTAVAALSGDGLAVRTGANTWALRDIVAADTKITVSNGDGVSGNPTVGLGSVPLDALSDVATAGAQDSNYLGYDSGTSSWEPQPLPDIVTTVDATNWTYQQESGVPGSGNGQFDALRGLAVDGSGNVLVADTGNNRVQKLDSSLAYVTKQGAAGTGNGQFASGNGAWAAATDASNNVWVVDRGNHRIQKFNSSLTYQSQIDGKVSSSEWVNTQLIGSLGAANGQFSNPLCVATDGGGNFYVADGNNNRIQKFDSSWNHLLTFASSAASQVAVDGAGRIFVVNPFGALRRYSSTGVLQDTATGLSFSDGPSGIATDGTSVWVGCAANPNIKVFNANNLSAGVSSTVGSSGTGNGQFGSGGSLRVAWDGTYLYAADRGNDRVQKFNSSGVYQTKWGTLGTGTSNYDDPVSIGVMSGGNIVVWEAGNSRIHVTTNTGTHVSMSTHAEALGTMVSTSSTVFWAPNVSLDKIEKLEYITGMVPGSGNGNFNTPSGIDIDRTPGTIFVVDQGNNRIEYFNSSGTYTGQWGSLGSGNNNLNTPTDLAVNQSTGDVYVVDAGNNRISQFGSTGTFVRAWGGTGFADGQFINPYSIDINDNTGNVFVTDTGRDDVQEFSDNGVFIRKFGSRGVGDGEYDLSYGLAFDQTGTHLYITDAAANRVQDFEEETTTQIATSVAFDRDDFSVGEIVTGRTFVGISPFPLDKLSDVAIGPVWGVAPAAGQVVTYDEPQAQWTNKPATELGLTFADLADTAISSPATGQVPVYNAVTQQWENKHQVIGIYQDSDYTGSNVNTAQKVFNESANGAANVAASTTYKMEGVYHIHTTGTTSHAIVAMFGGTATLTSIGFATLEVNPAAEGGGTPGMSWSSSVAGNASFFPTATATHHTIIIKGLVRVNAAGTFIPQYKFSSAPGVAPITLANSYFELTPIGSNVVTTVGSWS